MKDESLKDELGRISPRLSGLKTGEQGFQVPDGYFDAFEYRLMDRISADGIQRHVPVQTPARAVKRVMMYRWIGAAAAVLTLVFAAIWFFRPAPTATPQYAAAQLTDEDIEAYLMKNMQDFEDDQLALLREEEATPTETQLPAPGKTIKHTKDSLNDISPEDVDHLLNDMTEEELKAIL